MATIRSYQRKTELAPLRGGVVDQRVPAKDMLGGLDETALVGAALLLKAKGQADDARFMDAYTELGKARADVEAKYRGLHGKNALEQDIQKQAADDLEVRSAKILEGLHGPVARRFQTQSQREQAGLYDAITSHKLQEGEAFAEESYKGAAAIGAEKGARAAPDLRPPDPGAAGGWRYSESYNQGRQEVLDAVAARGKAKGWDEKRANAERLARLSEFHGKVFDTLKGSERFSDAEAYLQAHAAEIGAGEAEAMRKEIHGSSLTERASAVLNHLEVSEKDPVKRTDAIIALPGEVGLKAQQIAGEREAARKRASDASARLHLGTLANKIEAGTIRATTALEADPAFGKLEDDDKAAARKYLRIFRSEREQASRASSYADRQARAEQRLLDESLLREFLARPADERAAADVRGEFVRSGASPDGVNRALAAQLSAKKEWEKDRGISEGEFKRLVEEEVSGVYADDGDFKGFVSGMLAWRNAWASKPANAGKEIPRDEVMAEIARRTVVWDIPAGFDRPEWDVPPGAQGDWAPAAEQPYPANQGLRERGARRGAPASADPARPAAALAKAPPSKMIQAVGQIPEAVLTQMRADYARERPKAPPPSERQLVVRYNLGLQRGEW